ncbi:TetR/AcrR family transcriptional regulator [Streptomyces sp. NPDC090025]|uniref:TetR/AcrR family transcriptional regulator n=1 Tax=Streptomyces sp. NPDC090025 TaxID=3365922 RepID=UPI003834DCF7
MARTKEFDPDAALDAALELFWARGYEATSMADLVAHLGIARASVYATFGSKHELYMRAVERYLESRDPALMEELSAPGPALPGVRALVRRYAGQAAAEETRRSGCLITNSAAELAARDPAVARRVELSWEYVETLLHSSLVRARAQGELPEDRDPRALARLLLVVLQGVRVVGKASSNPALVQDAAEQALTLLD